MANLAAYELADGTWVTVQVDELPHGRDVDAAAGGDAVAKAGRTFDEAIGTVRPAIDSLMRQLSGLVERPKETHLEFALGLHIKAGAFIASTEADANFKVTLIWQHNAAG